MSKSIMVVATKFRLKVPIAGSGGQYDKKGQKEDMGTKIVPRQFVEERNSHDNNELYVIDEKKTEKLMKEREENIKLNAEKAKKEKTSLADLVDAVKKGGTSDKPNTNPPAPETKEEEVVTHQLTKEDIEANSLLAEKGFKVGDTVNLDKDGNIIFK